MHTKPDGMSGVTRLFDQLDHLTPEEAEKTEYARFCRQMADRTPSMRPWSFSQWKAHNKDRGNSEGQNHD